MRFGSMSSPRCGGNYVFSGLLLLASVHGKDESDRRTAANCVANNEYILWNNGGGTSLQLLFFLKRVNIELNLTFETYYNGQSLTVLISAEGRQSIENLCNVHRKNIASALARADALIKRFADIGRLRSPDQFRQETAGFWAIRSGTIRVYGWYKNDKRFVISHLISKRHDKLSESDIKKMQNNKKLFDASAEIKL